MPSNYAHYRFAQRVIDLLDERVWKEPALYYAGCHGADPMFYYNVYAQNPIRKIADEHHRICGKELFTRECGRLRDGCTDAQLAFLMGFLTHYCLDSTCHPYVNGLARQGVCGHAALETEFDRFLMVRDGIHAPHTVDLSEHVALTEEECAVAAAFFPPLTRGEYVTSLQKMHKANGLITGSRGVPRSWVRKFLERKAPGALDQMMTEAPDPRVAHLDAELLGYYRRAEERFPELLRQLMACLTDATPLGPEFDANFE
ncbi:MAG: zinc dependent phospholipase C family protein [Clostridia bacterium]|nr:zinc dependent phospholipase C family protein [Clostridia bacterium]